jgi:hypothetical protein
LNTSLSPSNDLVVISGALTFSGTLTVTNEGPALVDGDSFKLFSHAGTGSFTTLDLPALSGGLNWINHLGVDGTIAVSGSVAPPTINSVSQTGNNLILISTSAPNSSQRVLSSTNVALPIVNWTPVTTNAVGANGLFTNTIGINPVEPKRFYRLVAP